MGGVFDFFEDVGEAIGGAVSDVVSDAFSGDPFAIGSLVLGGFLGGAAIYAGGKAFAGWLEPDIPEIDFGPNYDDQLQNYISLSAPVALAFGQVKLTGNKVRIGPSGNTRAYIIGYCEGTINGFSGVTVNDIGWSSLQSVSSGDTTKSEYTGSFTQTSDSRFVDKAQAYRGLAYLAITFNQKNEKQITGDPNVITLVKGKEIPPLAGGADAYTRNPAVILYYVYTQLEGRDTADLDTTEFQTLETYCDTVPDGQSLARYRFDYAFDRQTPVNDIKKLIWRSFNGTCVWSQGKIKPVWEQSNDPVYSFDQDNIVANSFSWEQPERPNVVRVHFLNGEQDHKKDILELRDEASIERNGEIFHEEKAYYITDEEIARRRLQFLYNKFKYTDYRCGLTAFPESTKVELYDVVRVTHTQSGFTNKKFLVVGKSQDQNGLCTFDLAAYHSAIYDDKRAEVETDYALDLANPLVAYSVQNLSMTEGGFIAGDGTYVPYINLYFEIPSNPVYWNLGQIWISTSGTSYEHYADVKIETGQSSVTPPYKIESGGAGFGEGDTVYIKVLSENKLEGVAQTLSDVSASTLTIQGKTAVPSDPSNFSVSQVGDSVVFTVDRPSQGTDADFSHFELRKGSSWDSSVLVATMTHTRFVLTNWTPGAKLYHIKTVDTSGNKSTNYSSKSITLVASSTRNVILSSKQHLRLAHASGTTNLHLDYDIGGFGIATNRSGTSIFNTHTSGTSWFNAQTKPLKIETSHSRATGIFHTETIDIGNILPCNVDFDFTATEQSGTSMQMEIRTSEDDVTWSSWSDFELGSYTFRYLEAKAHIGVDRASYPNSGLYCTKFNVEIDVPDTALRGEGFTVSAGGTTVAYGYTFYQSNSVNIRLTVVDGEAKLPVVVRKTDTAFYCKVYDHTGADVGGTIDWYVSGY